MKKLLLLAIIGIFYSSIAMAKNVMLYNDFEKMYEEKGETLSWKDFEEYKQDDLETDLLVWRIALDNGDELIIGGSSVDNPPFYMHIIDTQGNIVKVIKSDM